MWKGNHWPFGQTIIKSCNSIVPFGNIEPEGKINHSLFPEQNNWVIMFALKMQLACKLSPIQNYNKYIKESKLIKNVKLG